MVATPLDPEEPYSVAKGYVQSAYAMLTNPHRLQLPDDTTFFMAFHMLCGFAVELYLKSYLAKKGYSQEQLRSRNVRHNLTKLREMAVSEGLAEDGSRILVDLLNDQHENFEFRYMKKNVYYTTIPLQSIFTAFSMLDFAVDTAIEASKRRGRKQGGSWVFPTDGPWRFPKIP